MRSRRVELAAVVMVAGLAIVGLAGCGGSGADQATATSMSRSVGASAGAVIESDDTVVVDDAADAADDAEVDALLTEIETLDDVAEATELEVAP